LLGTAQPVAKGPEVRCLWEVTEGNLGTAHEARPTGMRTGLGRGEGLDLDVGAVDELLVGEYVVRARDKEEEKLCVGFSLGF
jgi:hypothetical protein